MEGRKRLPASTGLDLLDDTEIIARYFSSVYDDTGESEKGVGTFHPKCGRGVKFSDNCKFASGEGFSDSFVFSNEQIPIGVQFSVKILQTGPTWLFSIGVTTENPDSGQWWDGQYWFVMTGSGNCAAYHNGQYRLLRWDLDDSAGNMFGCQVSETGELHLYHNERDVGVAWEGLPTDLPLWGFVCLPRWRVKANYFIPKVSETPSGPCSPIDPHPTSAMPMDMGASSTAFLEWQSAYEDSIRKHGSVSVEVTRSIFVGPSAAGKSSLKHLLVHNTPKAVQTSTAVVDTPEVVTKRYAMDFSAEQYVVEEGTSAWQLVSSDIMKNSLHACITSKAYEEKIQYPVEVRAQEAKDGQREGLKTEQDQSNPFALLDQYPIEDGQRQAFVKMQSQFDPLALISQYPIEDGHSEALKEEHMDVNPLLKPAQSDVASLDKQYARLLQEMRGEGGRIWLRDASFIHLLDTGGQPPFQDVLPLLLDMPCTYIQVFNASRSLDERMPITYRPDHHTVVHLDGAENGRDLMLRSFSSMQTMAQKCSKELASFRQKDSPLPQLRIFVVGTHKDELIKQGRLDKATKEIRTFLGTLKRKPYYNSIQWDSKGQQFFLINAMAANQRAYINNLREHISNEGSLKLDVPVMWFICQEVTRCTPKKFFRLQDLEAFCRKHGFVDGENAASQFRALLQLLTLLGFYAFFDLEDVPDEDNFVCTDRGTFLKEVSILLAVQFHDPMGAEMESFKDTGILVFTQKCFKQLGICQEIDAQWFLKALLHLGIAARLSCKDGLERYFIPAALPQNSSDQNPTPSVAPLCLTYTTDEGAGSSCYSYMPQGVFCRLVVELIHQGWKIIAKENNRTLLLFRWREFEIFLKESSGYISLIPQVVEEISTVPELHTECVRLRCTVSDCLSVATEAVLGSNFRNLTELAVGFECPCKKVGMPHLAVPSETGKSLDCLETCRSQMYISEQRIWFSSLDGVPGMELKCHRSEPDHSERRIWVLEDCTRSEKLLTTFSAQQALDHLRKRFIREVDATTIVHELEYRGIISDGVRQEVTTASGMVVQNRILHAHLVRTCTKETLLDVSEVMITAEGNPIMKALGEDMKRALRGSLVKCSVSTDQVLC